MKYMTLKEAHNLTTSDDGRSLLISDATQPDQPLVYVSKTFEEHTGYTREEVIGKNARFLQGPDTDPQTVKKIADALKEERLVNVQILNYRKDGSSFLHHVMIKPVFSDTGTLAKFVAVQSVSPIDED